jgi:hypothetical protein
VRVGIWTQKASFVPFKNETLRTDRWMLAMKTRCCNVHSTHNRLTFVTRTLRCVFWGALPGRHNWEGTHWEVWSTHSGISGYLFTYSAFGLWLSHQGYSYSWSYFCQMATISRKQSGMMKRCVVNGYPWKSKGCRMLCCVVLVYGRFSVVSWASARTSGKAPCLKDRNCFFGFSAWRTESIVSLTLCRNHGNGTARRFEMSGAIYPTSHRSFPDDFNPLKRERICFI